MKLFLAILVWGMGLEMGWAQVSHENETRVLLDSPPAAAVVPGKPTMLIIYALPNGNTIEQTMGGTVTNTNEWRFNIQHIGAQTRFLRRAIPEKNIFVAYLEADARNIPHSWPTWRKKHGDAPIAKIVGDLQQQFTNGPVGVALTAHSGGGGFVFGYINDVETIPASVKRIAFLDANYNYDPALHHAEKLEQWLDASNDHYLCILAYHDDIALLNGKSFVSAAGGTWGRSHQMLRDLSKHYSFQSHTNGNLETDTALNGRITFLLTENPEKKILHTVQVERNGFIEAILSGTPNGAKGYTYFGERAYTNFILPAAPSSTKAP